MGKLFDDYNKYPGWVEEYKRCISCDTRWTDNYHVWAKPLLLSVCTNCGSDQLRDDNVFKFQKPVGYVRQTV